MTGIIFTNNFAPEIIPLTSGKSVHFKHKREVFWEGETIEELRLIQESGGHVFESGEATEEEMVAERKRLEERNELLMLSIIEAGAMEAIERAEVARRIGALSAEEALHRGQITLAEFARRDLISMKSEDERELGVPPIMYNGRPYSAAELTEYLKSKGLKVG